MDIGNFVICITRTWIFELKYKVSNRNDRMKLKWLSFHLLFTIPYFAGANFGGNLLNSAMAAVLGEVPVTTNTGDDAATPQTGQFSTSKVRLRCRGKLACDENTPTFEIDNAIFLNGVLYLHGLDDFSKSTIGKLPTYLAGRPEMLPSSLVVYNDVPDWLQGPKVVVMDYTNESAIDSYPTHCQKTWHTSAYFHFPWEVKNSFHAMNDNVLSVLANVILQRQALGQGALGTKAKTLFLFNIKVRIECIKFVVILFEPNGIDSTYLET